MPIMRKFKMKESSNNNNELLILEVFYTLLKRNPSKKSLDAKITDIKVELIKSSRKLNTDFSYFF